MKWNMKGPEEDDDPHEDGGYGFDDDRDDSRDD